MFRSFAISLGVVFLSVAICCNDSDSSLFGASSSKSTAEGTGGSGGVTESSSSGGAAGETVSVNCGDGSLELGEECDDANIANNDSCTNACQFARCGDSILWVDSQGGSFEQCDDGNQDNGDGCSSSCVFETCGDGFFDPGEDCDDGSGGACPDTCRISECEAGCAPQLCGQNEVCSAIGTMCDGSVVSECVGHCMLWIANCAMVAGFPADPIAIDLVNCVGACLKLP